MNAENEKNFDELMSRAIGGKNQQFDFDKWQKDHKKEIEIFKSQVKANSVPFEKNIKLVTLWRKFGYLAATFLIVFSLLTCFALSGKVAELNNELELARQDIAATAINDSVTINFYIKEHQDFIAQQASLNSVTSQPVQIHVSQSDIMYYEFIDEQPEYMNPGIIVRGSPYQDQIDTSQTPAISNGHTLTLSEALDTIDFDLVSPSWLFPCYRLDQIRIIEGRDSLQLLYTNGINSISLFEQSLDGQRGLSHHDFREYAVYNNQGEDGRTILTWRDDALSYVLIGNTELSQLMSIAQSINTSKIKGI